MQLLLLKESNFQINSSGKLIFYAKREYSSPISPFLLNYMIINLLKLLSTPYFFLELIVQIETHKFEQSIFIYGLGIHPQIILIKMSQGQAPPAVQNVVSFAKLFPQGGQLELKLIAQKVSGSRYNKKRFPAVILRKTKPKSTILIFKSGKMIIIGSQSENDAELAAKKTVKQIQKLTNKKIKLMDFRVTNIVANADLGYRINIGKISEDHFAVKDDSFPGAVHKMKHPVKAVLLFSSGKVVFTGAKDRSQIEEAFRRLLVQMKKYKVESDVQH